MPEIGTSGKRTARHGTVVYFLGAIEGVMGPCRRCQRRTATGRLLDGHEALALQGLLVQRLRTDAPTPTPPPTTQWLTAPRSAGRPSGGAEDPSFQAPF